MNVDAGVIKISRHVPGVVPQQETQKTVKKKLPTSLPISTKGTAFNFFNVPALLVGSVVLQHSSRRFQLRDGSPPWILPEQT